MAVKRITTPLTDEAVMDLKAGDSLLISGEIYTARDAAHKRLYELIENGEDLPLDLQGKIFYYVGPAPAKPGQVVGSAGPTTSGRMDAYTPAMLAKGLKASIGKGSRNDATKKAMQQCKAVYLAATGGAGALLAKTVKSIEPVAYEELGPEAIQRMVVEDFPATVINDAYGNDLYEEGRQKYAQRKKEA